MAVLKTPQGFVVVGSTGKQISGPFGTESEAKASEKSGGETTGQDPRPDDQVRSNFKRKEFGHAGNNAPIMDEKFLDAIQAFREAVDSPVIINSGSRTPQHNKKVGGVSDSQHLRNRAADVRVKGVEGKELARLIPAAKDAGFTGIGIYNTHLHLDTRDTPSFWDKRK